MKSSNEVEIKFRVHNLHEVIDRLKRAEFIEVTPRTPEVNTLYDLPGKKLRRRGELLRLRNYGPEWLLTHKAKGKVGRHKSRAETETKLSDGGKMEGILLALGFAPSFRYEKFRAEWTDGKGHVVLDETPIGNFGEIEGSPRWIDATAKLLAIATADYITQSYAELFTIWKKKTRSPANDMTFKAVRRGRAAARVTTAIPHQSN